MCRARGLVGYIHCLSLNSLNFTCLFLENNIGVSDFPSPHFNLAWLMWSPGGCQVVAKWLSTTHSCQKLLPGKISNKQLIAMAMVVTVSCQLSAVSCQLSAPSTSITVPTHSLQNRHQHERHLPTRSYFPRSYVIDGWRLGMSTICLLIVDGFQIRFHPCSWRTYL